MKLFTASFFSLLAFSFSLCEGIAINFSSSYEADGQITSLANVQPDVSINDSNNVILVWDANGIASEWNAISLSPTSASLAPTVSSSSFGSFSGSSGPRYPFVKLNNNNKAFYAASTIHFETEYSFFVAPGSFTDGSFSAVQSIPNAVTAEANINNNSQGVLLYDSSGSPSGNTYSSIDLIAQSISSPINLAELSPPSLYIPAINSSGKGFVFIKERTNPNAFVYPFSNNALGTPFSFGTDVTSNAYAAASSDQSNNALFAINKSSTIEVYFARGSSSTATKLSFSSSTPNFAGMLIDVGLTNDNLGVIVYSTAEGLGYIVCNPSTGELLNAKSLPTSPFSAFESLSLAFNNASEFILVGCNEHDELYYSLFDPSTNSFGSLTGITSSATGGTCTVNSAGLGVVSWSSGPSFGPNVIKYQTFNISGNVLKASKLYGTIKTSPPVTHSLY